MQRRTMLAWGVAAAAAVAALAWAFAPRPLEVEVARVERGLFEAAIEEDGRTRVKDRYSISAPVAGRIERITLREGDTVAAGDPVAVITPVMSPMIDERSRSEAQARLRAAEASVDLAGARLARARAALQQAQLELGRSQRLAREGFVAASKLDADRVALSLAEREVQAARADQDVAGHNREVAAASLQPAQMQKGHAYVLRSPVAARVLRVPQPSEATVPAGTQLLELGDPSQLEVVAQLLTTDAVQAQPGTPAVIERWGGPPLAAMVSRVEAGGFTKVSALGIEEQRVNVILDLRESTPQWRRVGDGFRVTARVITLWVPDSVLVPVGAVFPNGEGGHAVFRLDGGRARLQPVDIGGRNPLVALVRQGLAPGQSVLVYPPPGVSDGTRVHVRKP
ncbi:MAG: efflux RND transporter periplasmic adaptor subunit [Ramlibacter sp.]